jgi:hypothetical protein
LLKTFKAGSASRQVERGHVNDNIVVVLSAGVIHAADHSVIRNS